MDLENFKEMVYEKTTGVLGACKDRLRKLPDEVSDFTRYAAVRVPLNSASGPDEVTLDVPGYAQINSYCCGVVAGAMVLKYFKPRASFARFYARVSPHAERGASTTTVARALRESGIRVRVRHQLAFDDLCAAIDDGRPVVAAIHNAGAEDGHWIAVYGYGRRPNRVFIATNNLPLFTRNVIPFRQFWQIWSPRGNGLICDNRRTRRPSGP